MRLAAGISLPSGKVILPKIARFTLPYSYICLHTVALVLASMGFLMVSTNEQQLHAIHRANRQFLQLSQDSHFKFGWWLLRIETHQIELLSCTHTQLTIFDSARQWVWILLLPFLSNFSLSVHGWFDQCYRSTCCGLFWICTLLSEVSCWSCGSFCDVDLFLWLPSSDDRRDYVYCWNDGELYFWSIHGRAFSVYSLLNKSLFWKQGTSMTSVWDNPI